MVLAGVNTPVLPPYWPKRFHVKLGKITRFAIVLIVLHNQPVEAAQLPPNQTVDAGCKSGLDIRSSDLCAQWKAADAAYDAARSAEYQTALGFIGLIFAVVTTAAAIAAAIYAKRAAVATEQTATIAEDAARDTILALDVARKNAEAASRLVEVTDITARQKIEAYLFLKSAEAEFQNGLAILQLSVENCGKTPAVKISFKISCEAIIITEKNGNGAAQVSVDTSRHPQGGGVENVMVSLAANSSATSRKFAIPVPPPDQASEYYALLFHIELLFNTVLGDKRSLKYKAFGAGKVPAQYGFSGFRFSNSALEVFDADWPKD